MAQHGYLREWDEGWGGGDDRDRWRNPDRERSWRGSDRNERDRDRGFMFDRDRDQERGFFDRMGDRAGDAFRSDDHHRGEPWSSRDWHASGQDEWRGGREPMTGRFQSGFGGASDWERSPRNYGSHQDDHYRSWRDKQMNALDRDYADYCREREQQFHQDFDHWRSNRQQPAAQRSASTEEVMELSNPTPVSSTSDPIGAATLGTNTAENSGVGRGKR